MYLTICSNFISGNEAIRHLKKGGYKASRVHRGVWYKDERKAIIRPVHDHNGQIEGYTVNELQTKQVQSGQVEFIEQRDGQ